MLSEASRSVFKSTTSDALLDVPQGGSFADMVALKGDKEIGDRLNQIISRLAEANDLKGVIDVAHGLAA